jgi:hypothetical protein
MACLALGGVTTYAPGQRTSVVVEGFSPPPPSTPGAQRPGPVPLILRLSKEGAEYNSRTGTHLHPQPVRPPSP